MSENTDAQLLELVQSFSERIEHLENQVKLLQLHCEAEVPDDVLVAIAAAVAAYLGHRARKRQASFARNSTAWQLAARRSQQNHAPIHLR